MSDTPNEPGMWQASDGLWYPGNRQPGGPPPPPPQPPMPPQPPAYPPTPPPPAPYQQPYPDQPHSPYQPAPYQQAPYHQAPNQPPASNAKGCLVALGIVAAVVLLFGLGIFACTLYIADGVGDFVDGLPVPADSDDYQLTVGQCGVAGDPPRAFSEFTITNLDGIERTYFTTMVWRSEGGTRLESFRYEDTLGPGEAITHRQSNDAIIANNGVSCLPGSVRTPQVIDE